jgi:hypothetical protein
MVAFKVLFFYTLISGFTAGSSNYRCGNEKGETCPTGYTCCGPIGDNGGTCRKLKDGEVCIF